VPKQRRKPQQHLRQTPTRRRSYTMGGPGTGEKYKPPFPMNLMQNQKLFFIIGAIVMIGGVVIAGLAGNCNPSRDTAAGTPVATVTPTATPDGSQTPDASATPNTKKFNAADQVVDAATKKYTATIKTDKGDIVVELFADKAPNTVNSFVFLAQKQFFAGIIFHRVVKDFVIQAGDPTGTGNGNPGYSTADEPNQVKNTRGTISMAKTPGAKSFGSQFFINLKDNPALDFDSTAPDKFYPFGQVTSGSMDVVDAIGKVTTDAQGKPQPPITIQSVTIQESPK
jgi:cyclophilin family peptidyl-prolyl cis-trans isomerase